MPNIFPEKTSRFSVVLVDILIILFSYTISFMIASNYRVIQERNIDAFISLFPWVLLIGVFLIYTFELDRLVLKDKYDIVRKLIVTVGFMFIFTTAASFLFREFALPRSVILMSHFFAFWLMLGWKMIYVKMTSKKFKDRAVFIGDEDEYELMTDNLVASKLTTSKKGLVRIHSLASLKDLGQQLAPYSHIFVGSAVTEKRKNEILYYAMKQNKLAYVIPNMNDLFVMKSSVTTLGDSMVIQVKPFNLTNGQEIIKRLLDLSVSAVMILVTLPLMLIAAILIKLEDRGPIFFKQERVGKDEKPFNVLKFRSMIVDAEAKTGPVLAKSKDNRITKIGAFMRKTRIDELPQLINVFRGDMSLVGPRPEREFFAKQFQKENKWFNYRNSVKPGITGYAQVLGNYTTSPERKLKFDLYYIRHYSIWLDIMLLLKTVIVVLNKSQAEGSVEKESQSNIGKRKYGFMKMK
ncbi:sugar transferase [Alkalihalobacillus alcalophilus ATCC 27647 = CGMCC 1.3604]|uniref:Sugar transferase n=1 Tax=Alkalihalobacillus alcalophilus ATCC 27647 = CGMCC 1.3604 TaxID=1218173 RepID=A0A094WKN9_ALKAL|nr:sugar transferase [Alkalihalobacillus alcalophilus]KGA96523.1 sugar transferase [Alkalihalobacillus alcalophilus ATCC 27647 = CGMCC 1.3604]MED1561679.1 sugar transferase [Alkalihalobacillus alcalophilus]THG90925.1 sugar transferase [Alkalihalobacillus alcalophilus ATCC 27647 = CGMCC 1.3604]